MPTRVYLLRHAETADPSVFHGAESDIGLSARGVEQAEEVAQQLQQLRPEVLVCSAMRRARDTAAAIERACGLVTQVEPLLHERRVGALSGTPNGLSVGPWPETLRRWMAGETTYTTPGAESFEDVRTRVVPVWERVTAQHAGKTLAVVAHGIVIRVLLLSLLPEMGPTKWRELGPIRNVVIHALTHDENGWHLAP